MSTDADGPPEILDFPRILRDEVAAINLRRAELGRRPLSGAQAGARGVLDAVGLSLSGGGVRSAAFSLGVLQALNQHDALRNVDYLSTVSGGGYIGSALSATMSKTQGRFVFGNAPQTGPAPPASEISDTDETGHLRNYSNYLIPAGTRDILTAAAIVLRGLIANFALVLPVILFLAACTIMTNPEREALGCPDLFGFELCGEYLAVKNFGLTIVVSLTGLVLFFLWALYRSMLAPDKLSEFRTTLPVLGAFYLILVAAVAFIELQTFFLAGMFDIADAAKESQVASFEYLTETVKRLATIVAPIAAVVTFFRQQLGDILKAASTTAKRSTRALALLSRAAFWIAGLALPLLIWVAYLYLSYWGIIDTGPESVRLTLNQSPAMFRTQSESGPPAGAITSMARAVPRYEGAVTCTPAVVPPMDPDLDSAGGHTPRWLIRLATTLTYSAFCPVFGPLVSATGVGEWMFGRALERPMALFYVCAGLLLFLLSWLLRPNANSLHRLYRDRLSKAFLFDPSSGPEPQRRQAGGDREPDFPALDTMRVSEVSPRHAPYHLINAALNIQGSTYANRRGRDADFFLFSPLFVGSEATGWARTPDFEQKARDLDLATAMAISGAAASSNMGSKSIRPLRLTLALLNIRLGYWLANPRGVGEARGGGFWRRLTDWPKHRASLFLFNEMTGRLYEDSPDIYATDGGHIENLGIYQLLRRRCRIIVAVDAEADLAMRFPAFIALQRYARIDLGVRIEMPWDRIQKTSCAWMGMRTEDPKAELVPAKGPHAAIGRIDYGGGRCGYLLYLKSSLTGDENDYIRDYARRNEHFPHETTGDQFFSEEQFEVYRALGFHVVHRFLDNQDKVQALGAEDGVLLRDDGNDAVKEVRAALSG